MWRRYYRGIFLFITSPTRQPVGAQVAEPPLLLSPEPQVVRDLKGRGARVAALELVVVLQYMTTRFSVRVFANDDTPVYASPTRAYTGDCCIEEFRRFLREERVPIRVRS